MSLDKSAINIAVARALDKLDDLVAEDEVDSDYENLRVGGVLIVVSVDYDTPEDKRDERWAEGTLTYVFCQPENPRVAYGIVEAARFHLNVE